MDDNGNIILAQYLNKKSQLVTLYMDGSETISMAAVNRFVPGIQKSDIEKYDKKQADLRIKYLENQEKKLEAKNDDLELKLDDYRKTVKALLDYISLKGTN